VCYACSSAADQLALGPNRAGSASSSLKRQVGWQGTCACRRLASTCKCLCVISVLSLLWCVLGSFACCCEVQQCCSSMWCRCWLCAGQGRTARRDGGWSRRVAAACVTYVTLLGNMQHEAYIAVTSIDADLIMTETACCCATCQACWAKHPQGEHTLCAGRIDAVDADSRAQQYWYMASNTVSLAA
jgi:hypothetical protein